MSQGTIFLTDTFEREGYGKFDVSLKYTVGEFDECYFSFKYKGVPAAPSLKGSFLTKKKFVQPVLSNDLDDPSIIIHDPDGTKKIPFNFIKKVDNDGKKKNYFTVTCDDAVTFTFKAGSAKKCRKWVDQWTTSLNQFKIENKNRLQKKNRGGNKSTTDRSLMQSSVGRLDSTSDRNNLMATFGSFKNKKLTTTMTRGGTTRGRHKTMQKTKDRLKDGSDFDEETVPPPLSNSEQDFDTHVLKEEKEEILKKIKEEKELKQLGIEAKPPPPPIPKGETASFEMITQIARAVTESKRNDKKDDVDRRNAMMPILRISQSEADKRVKYKEEKTIKFLKDVLATTKSVEQILLKNCDDEVLDEIVSKMFRIDVADGDGLVEKKQKIDLFYILESGAFTISFGDNNIKRSRGACFGELPMKFSYEANFSVVAKAVSVFWALSRKDYDEAVKHGSERLQKKRMEALKSVDIFKKYLKNDDLNRLAPAMDEFFVDADYSLREFESTIGQWTYVVQGVVNIFVEGDAHPKGKLVKGEHFGLASFFEKFDDPIKLVSASPKTVVFQLKVADFEELLGPLDELMGSNVEKAKHLKEMKDIVNKPKAEIKPVVLPAVAKLIQAEVSRARSTISALQNAKASHRVKNLTQLMEEEVQQPLELMELELESVSEIITEEEELEFVEAPPLLLDIDFHDIEVLRALNKGTFGTVYATRCNRPANANCLRINPDLVVNDQEELQEFAPRKFALKVMNRHFISRNGWDDKIDNELMAMAEVSFYCNSPFILKLYHSFCCQKFIYLLMEYGDGGDLYLLLRGQPMRKFAEREARYYVAAVINGLDVLHKRKILYRDLKPENLILNDKGELKVADLGLAKKTRRTNTNCGTPDYQAPEVLTGRGHDHACDWWAVGVLVFELHTGTTPFAGLEPQDIYDNIQNHKSPMVFYDENYDLPRRDNNLGYLPGDALLSRSCKALIGKLLVPKPTSRLGYTKGGADAVRSHEYFTGHRSFTWERFNRLQIPAPFVPELDEDEDPLRMAQDARLALDPDAKKDRTRWRPKVNTVLPNTPRFRRTR